MYWKDEFGSMYLEIRREKMEKRGSWNMLEPILTQRREA